MASESDSLRAALNIKGLTYLVYIKRPNNQNDIGAVYATSVATAATSANWGTFLVQQPDALDPDLYELIAAGDPTNDCALLSRDQGAGRTRIDTYALAGVTTPLQMTMAWSRDV